VLGNERVVDADWYNELRRQQWVGTDIVSGQEDGRAVSVLSGAVSWPHVYDRHSTHSNLLRDCAHHSMYSTLTADARLVLAAARDTRQNTPR